MDKPYRPNRGGDRDPFRDRDTFRDSFRDNYRVRGDRDSEQLPPRRPSRFSDGPVPLPSDRRRIPVSYNHDGFLPQRDAFDSPPRQPHGDYRPISVALPISEEIWPPRGGARRNVVGDDYRHVPRRLSPPKDSWPMHGGAASGPRSDVSRGDYYPGPAGVPSDELPPMRGGGLQSADVRGNYRPVPDGPTVELPPMRGGGLPRGDVTGGDCRFGPRGALRNELPPNCGSGEKLHVEVARGDFQFASDKSLPRRGIGGSQGDVTHEDYRFFPVSGPPDELPPTRGSGGDRSQSGSYRSTPGGGPPDGLWSMRGNPGSDAGGNGPAPHPQRLPMQQPPPPTSPTLGQKRRFPYAGPSESSPVSESFDGRRYVKLFVGSVPRTTTEDEIRPLFEEQGRVLEVALIKDKRTGQPQGCCFIKYANSEEADRAIKALHNQYTLPGGLGPVQVRYADGERERLGNGAVEYKLFVGSLNKFAAEKEVEEIFVRYGRIEDVYLMRDENRQCRGCGFVKFSNKDSAMAAISALNGVFTMRGCDQPLIVRFADPKRPRAGEPRAGPVGGGSNYASSPSPGIRPTSAPSFSDPTGGQGPTNAWQPMSPQNLGSLPNVGIHGSGNQLPTRSGEAAVSSMHDGHIGPQGVFAGGSVIGSMSADSTSSKTFNQPFLQVPIGQQMSPMQKPLQSPQPFPPAVQRHHGPGPTSQASVRPLNQLESGAQVPYGQPFSSQQLQIFPGQAPAAPFQVQQSAPSGVGQLRPTTTPSLTNSQLSSPVSQQPPNRQPPAHLTQMLSQQTQTLQASFQSSQQAFSQLQQEIQMVQPPIHIQPLQQGFQFPKQQSQWVGATPTTTASASLAPVTDAPSTSSDMSAVAITAPVKCNWTEHTSPDGYKYYHNSATGESRWVKPEELALYEQQQKKMAMQPLAQSCLHSYANQQVTQSQPQLQSQLHNNEHLQYPPPISSMYPDPQGSGNQVAQEKAFTQGSGPANSVGNTARFHLGAPATQDWAWKSNSGGR